MILVYKPNQTSTALHCTFQTTLYLLDNLVYDSIVYTFFVFVSIAAQSLSGCGLTYGTHSANFNKKVHKPQSFRILVVAKVKMQIMQKNKNKMPKI